MSLINLAGLHHLRITVTDLARSRAFYQDVLGFAVVAESPGDPSDPQVRNDPAQLYGGVVLKTAGLLFGLRPVADPADRFVSERAGLDHLSFSVASLDELSSAAQRLHQAGVNTAR
jgi:glyoxylase I family protein